ncbi:anhydro-N-acetylmuramic acid kinase [Thiohalobacter sp. IOR34]|uniref:anhydro-N-acetylmuramic acid kinase n=1 Tax=Thiohalobacter sp. IOR34 TaxID=3057176 RepID=UPI0025AF7E99|nr:anhydro-N-acetylmuramic acid kinase [Thiohalobacter sp. IOR34]WJW75131.1 anhydro-N-acetylmuramic acid kinase [Thiohalobacter sp. IOR34]
MSELYLGLMSGTSLDAVDAVAVDLGQAEPRLLAALSHPLPAGLRAEILALSHGVANDAVDRLGQLDHNLGICFAEAVTELCRRAGLEPDQIRAIGSHGQTLRHRPQPPAPFSLQIGDPNLIAERTGITTVADFRRRDLAAGGQGAPLVPAFHAAVFRSQEEQRVVLNIGGMANITCLPADPEPPVTGFDTGPGNVLIDIWIQEQRGQPFDRDGAWAASGRVDEALLERMLEEDFFAQPPPKSTGRELFNRAWLQRQLAQRRLAAEDVQATLTALTATSIAQAIERWARGTARILLCGGGARNNELIRQLRDLLPACSIESTGRHGLEPEWVEAVAFAWLAKQTLEGRPGNLPSVTGAGHPVVLGAIYPGQSVCPSS